MALEATHMRFALDLKDKYQVKDLEKYIVGSIYPDSHNISGLNRTETHNKNFSISDLTKNDFYKGWQLHLLVDEKQNYVISKLFSDLLPSFVNEGRFTYKEYPIFTAIKTIQDMNDMRRFDLQRCIKILEGYILDSSNKNVGVMKEYNLIMFDLYKNKKENIISDYCKMWTDSGVDLDIIKKVEDKIKFFQKDDKVIKKINNLYDETLKEVNLYLNNN